MEYDILEAGFQNATLL